MSRNRGLIQADASIDVTWDEFMLGINVTGTSMLLYIGSAKVKQMMESCHGCFLRYVCSDNDPSKPLTIKPAGPKETLYWVTINAV